MYTGKNIPLINENKNMKDALQLMSRMKLGCVIAKDKNNYVSGFISDGDIRRKSRNNLISKKVKEV